MTRFKLWIYSYLCMATLIGTGMVSLALFVAVVAVVWAEGFPPGPWTLTFGGIMSFFTIVISAIMGQLGWGE